VVVAFAALILIVKVVGADPVGAEGEEAGPLYSQSTYREY